MNDRNYLSEFEQLVLLAILRNEGDASGADIRRDLSDNAERERTIASIYVVLTRLENRGMVRSRMSDPTPVRGGRARRFFAVEAAGVEALHGARRLMSRMWDGVDESLYPEAT